MVGHGVIASPGKVVVRPNNGGDTRELETKSILIATGSDVMPLPGVTIDEERIVSSTGALDLDRVPEHLLIVGAGYIGLEMGTVWRRLGAKVTVVEFLDRVTPGMDGEVSREFQKILTKQGMTFRLGTKVVGVDNSGERLKVVLEPAKGGQPETVEADTVLVAIGRRPYTEGLGLAELGVRIDNRGRVEVDDAFRTSVPGIFAIGDVIRGPMLAHKAEEEGTVCVEALAGQSRPHRLRYHSGRRLHGPRGGLDRPDRGAAQGGRHGLQDRQVPLHGQQPRPLGRQHRRIRQDPDRRRDRPGAGRPHYRA